MNNEISTEEISDGFHTFKELYEVRRILNAALFNEWFSQKKYNVHKSRKHYNGELCFNGGWFIVCAELPTGQISFHYEEKYWNEFKIQETDKALREFDGHNTNDVCRRINAL